MALCHKYIFFFKKSHVNDVSYTGAFLAVMSQNVYHKKRYITSLSFHSGKRSDSTNYHSGMGEKKL